MPEGAAGVPRAPCSCAARLSASLCHGHSFHLPSASIPALSSASPLHGFLINTGCWSAWAPWHALLCPRVTQPWPARAALQFCTNCAAATRGLLPRGLCSPAENNFPRRIPTPRERLNWLRLGVPAPELSHSSPIPWTNTPGCCSFQSERDKFP